MIQYLYLALAIGFELVGTTCLKFAEGFSRPLPAVGCAAAYIACFFFLSKTLQYMNLSVVYAVWSGIGIIASTLLSAFLFHEQINLPAILGIVLIVAGVVILNLFGTAHGIS